MNKTYFQDIAPVRFKGAKSEDPLSFRYYDKDRQVLGKRMEDHLRFAVCYWHNFVWNGMDPFGLATFDRPWFQGAGAMDLAISKAKSAFDFVQRLGAPYYCFHDRDVAPEGATPRESHDNFRSIVGVLGELQQSTGIKLLWGTANLFSHRRFMSGAASNPDPAIFSMAALQVRDAMDATKELGGENYVLWGGREGYETLLNTRLDQELDQLGRFLSMAVEHKHKIGFKGAILIEPKPREPSKHQYDFDTATVYGFLMRYGLEKEVKVNIEANHATLSGHSFEHEIATAAALGILGSIDMNRGDPQLGWDTDQFPNNLPEIAMAMYHIVKAGGLGSGGLNFDAKVRRQSIDSVDLFHGHVGAMDICAQGLLAAEKLIVDGRLQSLLDARYAGWSTELGQKILHGRCTLDQLADQVLSTNLDVGPSSGRQELLENIVNQVIHG